MKIVYILRAQFGAGGGAAGFQYASLMNRKHDVLVLEVNNRKNNEKKVSYDDNVKVIDVYSNTMLQQVINVFNEIDKFKPDIIHLIQNPYALHYAYYMKHLTSYAKWIVDFRSPHVGAQGTPALKRYFYLQFYVDKIFTHSLLSLKTNISRRFFSAAEITPGINLKYFDQNEVIWNCKNIRRFIYIGSISKTRQLDLIINGFLMLNSQNKGSYYLDVYGNGNDYERLRSMVKKERHGDKIVFKGVLPQKQLLKVIPEYDAGIAYVPNEYFDKAPSLKSLEYAASGIPVVASNTSGHREYCAKYGFDFVFFENTVRDFSDTILRLSDKPYDKKIVKSNMDATKQFDWAYIVEKKLSNEYKKLTN